jgi:hypothetical protein
MISEAHRATRYQHPGREGGDIGALRSKVAQVVERRGSHRNQGPNRLDFDGERPEVHEKMRDQQPQADHHDGQGREREHHSLQGGRKQLRVIGWHGAPAISVWTACGAVGTDDTRNGI